MIPIAVFQQSLKKLLRPVAAYLDDASVSEVMINGPRDIFVERAGRLIKTDACFGSEAELRAALIAIAQYVGRPFDEMHPILEGRLPDGSRVEALLPPVAPDGPSVAIRRFSKSTLTIERLVGFGALTEDAAGLLSALVVCKQNIIVAGGTGSGKTSMLNALSSFIPDGDRIVVIEDARELQLQKEHVVQLEARPADVRGRGKVTIADLFRATLRMRPDRIVVGEIRGGEALELIQAMTSGHGGCLSTVHATYPRDTLNRLETMALMNGVELPLYALRAQIASAINIVVQTARLSDGSRAITHITELRGAAKDGSYVLVDLFARRFQRSESHDKLASTFEPTGALPACADLIEAHGAALPESMLLAAMGAKAPRVREEGLYGET